MISPVSGAGPAAVRFARLERRGLLLGLSGAQVACLGAALVLLTGSAYLADAAVVVVTSPLWLVAAVLGVGSAGGRPLISWLPLLAEWSVRRCLGATRHQATPTPDVSGLGTCLGPGTLRPSGVLAVPGLPGQLRILTAPRTGAALVLDRRAGSITAVLGVAGRGFTLADGLTQDRWVEGWGRVLAWLGHQPDVLRLQLVHRIGPGTATGARRWWADHAHDHVARPARLVAELIADLEAQSDRHETFLAVALHAPRQLRGRRGGSLQRLHDVEGHLAAFTDAVEGADLEITEWVTHSHLRRLIRATYDPEGTTHHERGTATAIAADEGPDGQSSAVGSMGAREEWDRVRTDSAWHAAYWISEWPRIDVHPAFLQPLLLAPGARRTLSLTVQARPPRRALREVRRAQVEHEADAAYRGRTGQLEQEATRAEVADLARREQELVAGHTDLQFVGLITVTAATREELDAACTATETAAAQAMCELRRLVGQQTVAHATASIPLARNLL